MFQEYPKFIQTNDPDEKGNVQGYVIFSKQEEPKKETPAEKPHKQKRKEAK